MNAKMKLGVLVCVVIGVSAAYSISVTYSGLTELSTDVELFDFGVVSTKGDIQTFRITNNSDRIIRVSEVVSTCSCADASISQHSLPPGATTELIVRFRPYPDAGLTQARIRLVEDGGVQSHEVLAVRGKAPRRPSVHPPYVQFGEVDMISGQAASEAVRLTGSSNGIPQVKVNDICGDRFSARLIPSKNGHALLEVTFLDGVPGGLFDGTASVELLFPSGDSVCVPIRGRTKSSSVVTPLSLSFLTVPDVAVHCTQSALR